jgi:hypothetical protein
MTDTAKYLHLVLLDLHSPAAAITKLSPVQLVINLLDVNRQTRRQAFDDRNESAAV